MTEHNKEEKLKKIKRKLKGLDDVFIYAPYIPVFTTDDIDFDPSEGVMGRYKLTEPDKDLYTTITISGSDDA